MEGHKADRLGLGRSGEDAAVRYLEKRRCTIVARRFRMLRGEIDIVARDGPTIVFVEVKTRRGRDYGPPSASVTARKQRQIRRIAQAFLHRHGMTSEFCRFDVISIVADGDRPFRIEHLKGAF